MGGGTGGSRPRDRSELAADLNYGSVYGNRKNTDGMTRKQILNELREAARELAEADAIYKQERGTPDEAIALKDWGAALRRQQDAHYAYESLSEEQGAHVAGHLARKEAEILTDPRESGAGDFENAPTRVYDGTPRPATAQGGAAPAAANEAASPQEEIDDAPTGRHRTPAATGHDSFDDKPTGEYRAGNNSAQGGPDSGSDGQPRSVPSKVVGGPGSVDTGGSTASASAPAVNTGAPTANNSAHNVDTNGATVNTGPQTVNTGGPTVTGGNTVNTGGQTVDTKSPAEQARRAQQDRNQRLEAHPIAPVRIPRDDEVFRVNTVNGSVEMTASEYRSRYRQAQRWVSEQMTAHHWGGAASGQSVNIPSLQQRAAEMFGLDRHWQRVGNPIINGKL
jgi:hypothetical protein